MWFRQQLDSTWWVLWLVLKILQQASHVEYVPLTIDAAAGSSPMLEVIQPHHDILAMRLFRTWHMSHLWLRKPWCNSRVSLRPSNDVQTVWTQHHSIRVCSSC
jgi:alpha-beta hydrolase superfamily lysophospholipase